MDEVMKNRDVKNVFKKLLVSGLAMVTVLSSVSIVSKAEDKTVMYELMSMVGYYDQDAKKAPTKSGYVFAGWYTDEGTTVATETKTSAYAKFVPAEVLSVKTQVNKTNVQDKNLNEVTGAQTLRVVSSVDSTRYQKVGFKYILGAKGIEKKNCESTEVYKQLTIVGDDNSTYEKTPSDYFGTSANWFFAMNITDISATHYSSQIYVQPYWVTLDGTTVYGQASNVFLEDHCKDKDYYRVSVNLFGDQDVAAGKVVATYDDSKFDVVDVVNGRLFKGEIESNKDTAGTVTIVGNASTVNEHEKASDLLMTVRFTKKSNVTDNLKFTSFTSQFCDWSENEVKDIVVQ